MNIKENITELIKMKTPSNYAIYRETGIAQSTLSDLKNGKTKVGNLKLDVALKLNKYYLKNFN